MRRRRVKITGIGPVTPAGIGVENFWAGIRQKRSYVRRLTRSELADSPLAAAFISDFSLTRYGFGVSLPKGTARHTELAVGAALFAVRNSGISLYEIRDKACAVVVGASLLDFGGIGKSVRSVLSKGYKGAQPRVVFTSTLTAMAEAVANSCNVEAKTIAIQTSCCSGLDAVGHAARMIESGEVDIAICGGTEAPLYPFPIFELQAAGLTPSTNGSPQELAKPFDLWRTTGVVSEGACFFVLESDMSPRESLGWISGYGFSSDSRGELCAGLVDSSQQAMADARVRPSEVECISAWGPGHRLVDRGEFESSEKVFGGRVREIPAFSIKGAIGSALGAAPAIQLAAAALGVCKGQVLHTVNWSVLDPECAYSLSNVTRYIKHKNALVNAHGVGGVNSSVIISKC